MTGSFHHSQGFSRITVNVDPDRTPALVKAAVGLGLSRVFVVKSRGVLHPRKIGFFTVPGISPLLDTLHMIVPCPQLDTVLDTLVRVGELDQFGAGSIYASTVTDLWYWGTEIFHEQAPTSVQGPGFDYQTDLVAISCISQLDHAEEIALAAMQEGSPSPTIWHGYGHGIRDRLGPFLQLTINPKKEFIELVVGSGEAERIFETMVEAGRLDRPAQGFISYRPVDIGLINTASYQQASPYPATMEQIIKAIDQIQGNTNWRKTGTLKPSVRSKRRKLADLVTLECIVVRGFGDLCSMVAMEAGAGGTSTYFASATPQERHEAAKLEGTDEREIITLTVAAAKVEPVVRALAEVQDLHHTPVVISASPAPQAVTYLK